MAPAGQKLGKLVHPACQHSPFAKAYLCSHLTWQDRVGKERMSAMAVSSVNPAEEKSREVPRKSQSLTALELARHEYHPIGGNSKHNNNSGQLSLTMGPKSWHASGGLKSEYNLHVGKATLPAFGAPPQASTDLSFSKAVAQQRKEGQKKAHADQMEAIHQHGVGTIIRQHGANPVEEHVFRGDTQSRGASGRASVRSSRLDSADSWGSVSTAGEMRRIGELGEKMRQIGRKGAAVHQVEAIRQQSEQTILRDSRH